MPKNKIGQLIKRSILHDIFLPLPIVFSKLYFSLPAQFRLIYTKKVYSIGFLVGSLK